MGNSLHSVSLKRSGEYQEKKHVHDKRNLEILYNHE